jgi:malate dehydrogenase
MVIGGHSDTTMLPLTRYASYKGRQIYDILEKPVIDKVVKDTMTGGATLTSLIGTSAWVAPGVTIAYLVQSIVHDKKKIIPCSVYLEGEYGQNDICIGVPCVIGKNGVEEILDYKLNAQEQKLFDISAAAVRKTNNVLKEFKAL